MRFIPALALILPATIPAVTAGYCTNVTSNHADRAFQRDGIAEAELFQKPARGIKKMSDDEGEKFFFDYWQFEDGVLPVTEMGNQTSPNEDLQARSFPLRPALALGKPQAGKWLGVPPLFRRDFECPDGTSGCGSIDRPDRCCGDGDTCTLVPDTGSGDVGCCPKGQSCSDTIGKCPGAYSTCSESLGGGCCIPGYECVQGGCKFREQSESSRHESANVSSRIGAHVSIITVTVHSTVMVSTKTYTTPQETSSSSSSSTTTTTRTDSTGDLVPPARPTSLSTATTSKGTSEATGGGSSCPTGFYACSAVYQGGCCRTGRDCDTTSCPVVSSTTMITDGRTIVVPAPTMTGGDGRRCAQGWFSCADTVGGGCCPTGFACGSSCSATGGQATTVAKNPPDSSDGSRISWEAMGVFGGMVLIIMML